MNEEIVVPDKQRTKYELIAVVVLLCLCIFFYYMWNESKKAHDAYVSTHSVADTVGKINKPVDEVKQREAELYPKIDANIASINKDIKSLNASMKRLEKNQPTKEQSNELFKNKDLTEISDFFAANGFPNTATSCESATK